MEPILNELSVEPVEGFTAHERLYALCRTLTSLRALGVARVLRSTQDTLERQVAADVSVRAWMFSRDSHREERQLLRSYLSKAPFVEEMHARAESAAAHLVDVRHRDRPAKGLGAALLLRSTAVSLIGMPEFAYARVPVSVATIDGGGDMEVSEDHVHNVWDEASVERERQPITARVLSTVASGAVAWQRRGELFDHLHWSTEAEVYLLNLLGSEAAFHDVIYHLVTLSQAAAAWSAGPFEPPLRFSVETAKTLGHPSLGPQRDCTFAGNVRRLSLHLKLQSAWRIYYEFSEIKTNGPGDSRSCRVVVGYIGPHLRTSNDLG